MDDRGSTIVLHSFYNMSRLSPVLFLYLLKECYVRGTLKATVKFRALLHQTTLMLSSVPAETRLCIFVVRCLHVLPVFDEHCEGMSHLLLAALRRVSKSPEDDDDDDFHGAKQLSVRLFTRVVGGDTRHEGRIVVKLLEHFKVGKTDIDEKMLEKYLEELVGSKSYGAVFALSKHFSMLPGHSFFLKLMSERQFDAAEELAGLMGNDTLCILVEEYTSKNMQRRAYEIIKKHGLQKEFPEISRLSKERSLERLVKHGCWDLAKSRVKKDKQLAEYLVKRAADSHHTELVGELCEKFSIEEPVMDCESAARRSLSLSDLSIEEIVWVDEVYALQCATSALLKQEREEHEEREERCWCVGIDCEWRANDSKGSVPNKVSILQVATDRIVYIIDLIKLFDINPVVLDHCLSPLMHSPHLLKIGYGFHQDALQLRNSYGGLNCFKNIVKLLDIRDIYREPHGGLSGLSEKIVGLGLNKTVRVSNWEKRPLTRCQMEYAALDAAVLVRIFRQSNKIVRCSDGISGRSNK